jgi:hypothetical protein
LFERGAGRLADYRAVGETSILVISPCNAVSQDQIDGFPSQALPLLYPLYIKYMNSRLAYVQYGPFVGKNDSRAGGWSEDKIMRTQV